MFTLSTIDRTAYARFAIDRFADHGLQLPQSVFDAIYARFDGHTWYVQYLLNRLYGYNRDADTKALAYALQQITADGYIIYDRFMGEWLRMQPF